ncbi:MAG: glycine dehydrogenase (aminomethyl-transferring), partial [Bacteroidota bacterium]|nr:glycine dehydrogenase (aminomethyl-transferring) [Bacteroidota bacterium]
MAGMYAVYHGPEGIRNIAMDIHQLTITLANELSKMGLKIKNEHFFDTLEIEIPGKVSTADIEKLALSRQLNFRYIDTQVIGLSIDETTSLEDINSIVGVFSEALGSNGGELFISGIEQDKPLRVPDRLRRKSEFLQHPVFNSYHSETEMMRYMKLLENKDLALNRTMIPLGSCTMKLNAASEMFAITWP